MNGELGMEIIAARCEIVGHDGHSVRRRGGVGVRATLKPAPTRSSVEQGGESHVPVGGSGRWEWPVCGWLGRSGRKGGWGGGDVPRAAWARALRRRNNFSFFLSLPPAAALSNIFFYLGSLFK